MFPLLTSSESYEMDKSLISSCGLSERFLVTNAASGAFELYKSLFVDRDVLFVVGKGNNGSDALALALLCLPVSRSVSVYMHYEKGNEENGYRRSLLPSSVFVDKITPADTIVDGLFGVRYRLPADERTEKVINSINSSASIVLSLDCPSLYMVEADYTIAFMSYKREMFLPSLRAKCGRITLFNPGFPQDRIVAGASSFLLFEDDYRPPVIKMDGYKNTRGHVCVAGGSRKYPGAPILSSLAAFSAGAGKVTLYTLPLLTKEICVTYPYLMVTPSSSPLPSVHSYVIGPGWDRGSRRTLERIIGTGKPFLVDADAIKLLGGLKLGGRGVITPHIGEFNNLLDILSIEKGDIIENAREAALMLECVVVVKGVTVIITDGEKVYIKDGAEPGLGVAGSGDVLAGITGAFLSRGQSPLLSAVNAVILHQKCGRILGEKYGFYSAGRLIEEVGRER